ncbi:DgyrCDS4502 [Dimorphilus gyrociliatus]|nr:DgyrCDS4502 [Dimorphilus gyrociliatus]
MSGWKKAKSMVKKDVLPVFELLNIKVTILETERKGHLKEHVQTLNVDDFDGIIVAGGDGSFAELINGLLEKGMKDANLDLNTPGIRPPSPNVTLGILPCGTGNGLANSSHGCLDPVTAALHIVKGISIPSKAFTVHSGSKFMRYGFLCGGYGVFSLAIKRSETNRWMGPLRYVYGMFSSMAQNKDFMVTTSAEVYTTDNRIDGPTEWKEFPKTVRNVEIFIYDMREGWGNTTKQGLQNALFVCLVLPCKVWEQFKGVYKLITRNPTRFDKDCYLPFNCRSLKMEWDDDAIGYDGYINVDGEITNLPERNCCLTAFGDAFRVFGRSEKVQDEKH